MGQRSGDTAVTEQWHWTQQCHSSDTAVPMPNDHLFFAHFYHTHHVIRPVMKSVLSIHGPHLTLIRSIDEWRQAVLIIIPSVYLFFYFSTGLGPSIGIKLSSDHCKIEQRRGDILIAEYIRKVPHIMELIQSIQYPWKSGMLEPWELFITGNCTI